MKTNNVLPVDHSETRTFSRVSAVLVGAALSAFLCLAIPLKARGGAHDKHQKIAREHIALGTVVNEAKHPIEGAVVYLENPKSLDIKSYLTHADGAFHFRQLSPQTDYEVWAELNGEESKHQFISQFSSHTHFDFTLKLNPKDKKKKLLGLL